MWDRDRKKFQEGDFPTATFWKVAGVAWMLLLMSMVLGHCAAGPA